MAQSFTCPSCGAPLDYTGNGASTIPCPYCYTSVIVPQELRSQPAEPVAAHVATSLAGRAHQLRELANLVRAKQRDQAVGVYQQVYQVDIATAQRFVDQLLAGGSIVITSNTMGSPIGISFGTPTNSFGAFPASPVSTSPASYTLTTPVATYSVNAGQPANRWLWYIGCFVGFSLFITAVTVLIPLFIAGAALFPFQSQASTPIRLPNVDATTTAAFALATRLAVLPTGNSLPTATSSATPEPTEDPAETATAAAAAQAGADQAATQAALPVLFADTFDRKRSNWTTGPSDNDYLSGARAIADGAYRWTIAAKQNVASFVYPTGVKTTGDLYASVDVKITGPADSDAGLVVRHKPDDSGWYYFALGGDGQYSFYIYTDSQWEALLPLTSSTAVTRAGPNTLSVAVQGSHFVLLINGEVVGTVDDDRIGAGETGLAVELANANDSGIFAFDNFEIRAAK